MFVQRESMKKIFNNSFAHCHGKWLKWATTFHNAEFSLQLTTAKTNSTPELYSTTEEQWVR
jgi:hypothetical protein